MKPILWIYGSSGSGKTEFAKTITADAHTLFISAEIFSNALIDLLSKRGPEEEFIKHYQQYDFVVIDDVDYSLRGKERTQEEYARFIKYITIGGRTKVVLISKKSPRVLPKLKFTTDDCFFAHIARPTLEIKIILVEQWAYLKGINIPLEIVNFLAKTAKNLFELKGMFLKVYFEKVKAVDLSKSIFTL